MDFADYDWLRLLEMAVIALLILLVTWLLARAVRWAMSKLVGRVSFLQRGGADGQSLGDAIGQVAALLIWLFGLVAILQVFALDQVLGPIQSLLDTVLGFLPNIIGAAFVFFIGFLIARIVKQVIQAALSRVNFAGLVNRARGAADRVAGEPTGRRSASAAAQTPAQGQPAGSVPPQGPPQGQPAGPVPPQGPPEGQVPPPVQQGQQGRQPPGSYAGPAVSEDQETNTRITDLIANVVFAIIIIVVAIAALQILGIDAISDPATQMLQIILNAIPLIIAAALILALGLVIAKFAGNLLEGTLKGLGTDRAVASLGIQPRTTSASTVIARIAQVLIMLFFAIMAAQTLNFPQVTVILNEVLALGGSIIVGGAIIAVGFFVANLVARTVGSSTGATIVRYVIIVLFAAMGLQFMGVADSIINMAFGAVVIGGALAFAIAYGLGGRDAAARSLDKLEAKAEKEEATPSESGS